MLYYRKIERLVYIMTFCVKQFNGKIVTIIHDLCRCGNINVMFIYDNEPLFVCGREWEEDDVIGSNEFNYIVIDKYSFIVYKELINTILKQCLGVTIENDSVKTVNSNIVEYCVTFKDLKSIPVFLADNRLYL